MYGNNIEDISVMSKFKNLKSIGIATNKISNISPLQSLSELTNVDIRYNNVDFESEINKVTHDKLIDNLNNYRFEGQEVNLDPEGNYYDIDYDKLSDYIQVPDDKKNYILQNPVGKIFYMENLNETGKSRVNYNQVIKNDEDGNDDQVYNALINQCVIMSAKSVDRD